MSRPADVVVIGAGQNGLAAAAYLARAGRRVVIVERRDAIGGCNSAAEILPGYRVDTAFDRSGWIDPAMVRELGLDGLADRALLPETALLGLEGDGGFALPRSIAAATEAITQRSPRDAARWADFTRLVHKLAGFLQHLYGVTPPQLTSRRAGDLLALLSLGSRVRGLGRSDMIELLRVLPMSAAELLDDWFETDALKGLLAAGGVTGLAQGPRSAGTAFVMLHHHVGAPPGAFGSGLYRGGTASVTAALAASARGAGVEIRTGSPVSRISVRDGRATGVVLENGDEMAARSVVSTADPRRTMLGLVDPVELEPDYTRAMQNLRYRGVSAKVNFALSELPRFGGADAGGERLRGVIRVSPSLDYLERAWDDAKHGGVSRAPFLEATIPSLSDPSLAPPGSHVMSVWMQYAPWRLRSGAWDAATRERLGDGVVDCLAAHAPNFRSAILAREVLTPGDLEARFAATEGNLYQGEMALDQILFMRPVPGWGHHRTPIGGLFLAGSGTHPGGGVVGGAGRLAAREMLKQKESEVSQ